MIAPTAHLGAALRLFGEPTRLRILGLLELSELSVGELADALGMQQSRVSNHLRLLRDAHLLQERHEGRATYLRLGVPEEVTDDLVARLWSTLRAEIPTLPEFTSDVARLHAVIARRRARSRSFFDRVASEWEKIGVDFEHGEARERVAAHVFARPLVLADLGCGTGYLASSLVGLCAKLVCVDSSAAMLEEARKKLEPIARGAALEFRRGELDELPIADDELDGCVAGMVLHHLDDPADAVREMRRVLKPGSSAVVLELAPHKEEWMRDEQGDHHLGLDPRDVRIAFERAGFVDARIEAVEDRYQPKRREPASSEAAPALPLYIVRGRVPSGA
ncbi:MAG: metalloregulator ArsR/SmtB family transcription factor [Planctomycetes bacterium]|nr:metalloregulator ArsR/SmtB family transcription factor [Planctomycetota bacterium]